MENKNYTTGDFKDELDLNSDFFTIGKSKIPNLCKMNFEEEYEISVTWPVAKYMYSRSLYCDFFNEFEKGKTKVTFDIGSNIGIFSRYASYYSEKVYAFDPIFELEKYQKEMWKDRDNIIPVRKAITDKEGEEEIFITYNFLASYLKKADFRSGKPPEHEIVKQGKALTITLEEFCEKNKVIPDFIKMDCEGYEEKIIKNSAKFLLKHKPYMLVFVHTADRRVFSKIEYLLEKSYTFIEYPNDGAIVCIPKK